MIPMISRLLMTLAIATVGIGLFAQDPSIDGPGTGPFQVGTALTFSGSSASSGTSPQWTFGDGTTGTGWSVSHAYSAPGTYTVKLMAVVTFQQCALRGVDADGNGVCLRWKTVTQNQTTISTVIILRAPSIGSLSSSPSTIYQGQGSTLSWAASDATRLSLSYGSTSVDVAGRTSYTVNPAATTTYTLTAMNAVGNQAANCSVAVIGPPTVSNFRSDKLNITQGESAILSWSATNVVTELLCSGPGIGGPQNPNGSGSVMSPGDPVSGLSVTVSPSVDTCYMLTVINPAGTVNSSKANLRVWGAPTIQSFTADATTITTGTSTILRPTFQSNNVSATVSTVGSVNTGDAVTVSPTTTTNYTLTVTNPAGRSASKTIRVTVASAPAIRSFSSQKPMVTLGTNANLTLLFSGGTATIDGVPGSWSTSPVSVPLPMNQIGVFPFTLRVKNAAGTEIVANTSVEVVARPSIQILASGKSFITRGEATNLTAFFSGGTASLTGVGTVINGVSNPVAPITSTDYTLSVTNAAGDSVNSTTRIGVVDAPLIQSFTVSVPRIRSGETAQLTALFTGGIGTVSPDIGTVLSGIPKTVQPAVGTDYKLTVTNMAGMETTRTVHLDSGLSLRCIKNIVYVGDKEVAEIDQDGVHVTLTDHLGSPRFMICANGQVIEQKFLPFGEQLTNPDLLGKFAKGFTNHEQTDASGLIYMQARFYLPMYGRFASPDPARDQHFEETQSWNIYSYVRNNPVTMTDPTGMVTGPGDALNSLIGASTTLSEWWRERVSDPLERLSNKINGNGWVENRDLPNAGGEKAVPVPIIFCGGVVPVGMPMPAINLNLPGPPALQVAPGGTAVLAPTTLSVPVPVPAVAMTGGSGGFSGTEKTPQDRRLTKQEVKILEEQSGQSAHDIKGDMVGNKNVSKYDLFKNKVGEVVVKLKNGKGAGEPTGHTLPR